MKGDWERPARVTVSERVSLLINNRGHPSSAEDAAAMSNPMVGAVQAENAQKGVKRTVQGNPVGVPMQLPGFRGRSIDAGAAVKAPKLRNGNLNNETSNEPLCQSNPFTVPLRPSDAPDAPALTPCPLANR